VKELKGKNALLTGGSRGLGPYVARALAEEGVNLALTARSGDDLRAVAAGLESTGVRVVTVPGDITDGSFRVRLLEEVVNAFGRIDLLVNNAGIEWVYPYAQLEPGAIEQMIQTNLASPMLLTRMALPDMIRRGTGHVVTMSSLGGKKGSPYSATYAATKAGLIEWTRGLREELRGSGVSASVICPGFVAEAGMFAVYNMKAPGMVGETTPEKVAGAVVRAVRGDVGEIIVTPALVRPMMVLDVIHPGIGAWLLRTFGVYDFYRRKAEKNVEETQSG